MLQRIIRVNISQTFLTHDYDVRHALEGGLFDLYNLILVDAELLQALGHVDGHVLQEIFWQVEALELAQRAESFRMDSGDFVVHQNQSLGDKNNKKKMKYCHWCSRALTILKFASEAAKMELKSCSLAKNNSDTLPLPGFWLFHQGTMRFKKKIDHMHKNIFNTTAV